MEEQINSLPNINSPKSDYSLSLMTKELAKNRAVKFVMILFIPLVLVNLLLLVVKSNLTKNQSNNRASNISITSDRTNQGGDLNISDNPGSMSTEDNISSPESVVNQYLTYIRNNDKVGAKSLISQSNQTQTQNFQATLEGIDDANSLYGKNFTFQITKTQMEVQKTIDYVWVTVYVGSTPESHFFTLLKLPGDTTWKLVDDVVTRMVPASGQ